MSGVAGVDGYRKVLHAIKEVSAILLLLTISACVQTAYGQASNSPAAPLTAASDEPQKIPTEATPYLIERRKNIAGAKFDTRFRVEMNLGERRDGCADWRIETFARPDGRLVFQLNDPADKYVVLDAKFDPQYLELVLGDRECNYRIRIERNK